MSSAEWGQPNTQAWQVPLFSLPKLSIQPTLFLLLLLKEPGRGGSEEIIEAR